MNPSPHIPPLPTELSSLFWFFSFWGRSFRYFFTSTMQKTVFANSHYDEMCNFSSYLYSSTTSYAVTPTPMKNYFTSTSNTACSRANSSGNLLSYALELEQDDMCCLKGAYRFGFNGQERDDEIYGLGNSYTAEFWQYDARLGRRWNLDPVVKPHESPFATFANNPICFVDQSGLDTSFADNQARSDFNTAYNNVNKRIESLNEQIKEYDKQLSDGNLSNRRTNRINRDKSRAENTLANWGKLEKDFDEIINSPIMFYYSSNTDNLDPLEFGMTGGEGSIINREDGEIVGGNVNIQIRPGHDEAVIHENRHGNQILEGTNTRPVLERERDAFIYQRIYNYSSVQENIDNTRIQKYGINEHMYREFWKLDDMINFLYGN
ncbi:MAG: hypothetical protein PHT69_05315 [Bacteroidales bacterium]|nr:hypothetical protein [Bacteroidales bacterium]